MNNLAEKNLQNGYEHLKGREISGLRSQFVKHFDLGAGKRQAVVYAQPVHFYKDGRWQEIDNNLQQETKNGRSMWRNRNGALQVELLAQAGEGGLVKVTGSQKSLSWRFEKQQPGVSATVKNGAQLRRERLIGQALNTARFAARTSSTLSDCELESLETAQDRRADVTEKSAQARYQHIAPGVTVNYTLQGDALKEDIILENKEALGNAAILFQDEGLRFRAEKDGSVQVLDQEKGDVLFVIEPPFAYDSENTALAVEPMVQPCALGTRLTYSLPSGLFSSQPGRFSG